ncbi:MAG: hypothetical protein IPM64_08845 [Phycisphaerales bacterium]|nr:hypothetical protein [Phycisphaerales bacterium]
MSESCQNRPLSQPWRSRRYGALGVSPLTIVVAGWLLLGAIASPAAAGDAAVCGRRTEVGGIPVIEVWGTPCEAGFAQGYLLAPALVSVFDDFVLSPAISRSPEVYEEVIRPAVRRSFVWSDAVLAEMEGILAGAAARLGAAPHSRVLNRAMVREDLEVANTLADWRGVMCSSISLWGERTTDGETLTARNLDYPVVGGVDKAQFVLVHRGDGHVPWVGVSWPGLIGLYTAMNADGVTVSVHDARGLPTTATEGFTARATVLREALEGARGGTFAEQFQRALEGRVLACGGNIHVSGPRAAASGSPARVFEWDGNRRDSGVSSREAPYAGLDTPASAAEEGSNGVADHGAAAIIACTNHMRLRREPTACGRYQKLTGRFEAGGATKRYDAKDAMALIREVADGTTQHSVVFEPARRRMLVHISALRDAPVVIDLAEILRKPVR